MGGMNSQDGFTFYDIASTLLEDDGKPPMINLCKNCYDCRVAESGESKSDNCSLERYDQISRDCWPLSGQTDSSKEFGAIYDQLGSSSSCRNESPHKGGRKSG